MLMPMGPHTALGNIPRSIEYSVEWVTDLLRHAGRSTAVTRVEATAERRSSRGPITSRRWASGCCPTRSFLDDRHQPERRGQADPHHRPLQRQRAGLRERDAVAADGYRGQL